MSDLTNKLERMVSTVNINDVELCNLLKQAATRMNDLEKENHTGALAKANKKLLDVATQIRNWSNEINCYQMEDVKDPNWAALVNGLLCFMRRQLNDEKDTKHRLQVCLNTIGHAVAKSNLSYEALASYIISNQFYPEIDAKIKTLEDENASLRGTLANTNMARDADHVTIQQLAAALEIDATKEGWVTTMLNKAESLMLPEGKGFRAYVKDLEQSKDEFERCKNRIAAANARWGIKVPDTTDYPKQLDYLIDELEVWRKKGTLAQDELDLAVGAIRRMHETITRYKDDTGVWPGDGRFRAKLDDVEWCLTAYVTFMRNNLDTNTADTKFLKDIASSIKHEVDRREKGKSC